MASRSGLEKAGLVLRGLPPETAERILGRLGPAVSARLRPQMQAPLPQDWAPAQQEELCRELLAALDKPRPASSAVVPTPAQLAAYQPPEEAGAGESQPSAGSPKGGPTLRLRTEDLPEDPIDALTALPPDLLVAILEGEQVHTVALVLGCLPGERAGEVLKQLPPEMRREVSLRLTRPGNPNPLLVSRIVQAIVEKGRTMRARTDTRADARYEKMAQILRVLEKTERLEVLAALDEKDAETAARIRELLYQFEDVLRIQDRSMQKLLGELDSKTLATALKGVSDEIRDKLLNNLSKRARESLAEEIELMGSVPSSQAAQAQKTIVEVIQRLDQAGEIVMDD